MIADTRLEQYLAKWLGNYDGPVPVPISRAEQYLSFLCGDNTISLPAPVSRLDHFLHALCTQGYGAGSLSQAQLGALADGSIRTIQIQEGVEEIRSGAFYECENLEHITLPDSVRIIHDEAFARCKRLVLDKLPEQCEVIWVGAFSACESIRQLTLGENLAYLSAQAFYGCKSLVTVTFRSWPYWIWEDVFSECPALQDIYCPWEEGDVEGAPWGAESATIHYLGRASEQRTFDFDAYMMHDWWLQWRNANGYSLSYDKNRYSLPCVSARIGRESGALPKPVSRADRYLRYLCGNTEAELPEPVSDLDHFLNLLCEKGYGKQGMTAEEAARLASGRVDTLPLGEGIEKIRTDAFYDCLGLELQALPRSVRTIGAFAFGCTGLKTITLGENVEYVGEGAFFHCMGLQSVTFHSTLEYLAQDAFLDCLNLKEINCPWGEGAVEGAPWGAENAMIHYGATKA